MARKKYCAEGITSKVARASATWPSLIENLIRELRNRFLYLTRPEPRGDKPSTQLFARASESTYLHKSTPKFIQCSIGFLDVHSSTKNSSVRHRAGLR